MKELIDLNISFGDRHFVVGFDHVFYFNTKADFDKFATLAGDDAENVHSSVLDIALGIVDCCFD
jgi:hypothetical protein